MDNGGEEDSAKVAAEGMTTGSEAEEQEQLQPAMAATDDALSDHSDDDATAPSEEESFVIANTVVTPPLRRRRSSATTTDIVEEPAESDGEGEDDAPPNADKSTGKSNAPSRIDNNDKQEQHHETEVEARPASSPSHQKLLPSVQGASSEPTQHHDPSSEEPMNSLSALSSRSVSPISPALSTCADASTENQHGSDSAQADIIHISYGGDRHEFKVSEGDTLTQDTVLKSFGLGDDTTIQVSDAQGNVVPFSEARNRRSSLSLIIKRNKSSRRRPKQAAATDAATDNPDGEDQPNDTVEELAAQNSHADENDANNMKDEEREEQQQEEEEEEEPVGDERALSDIQNQEAMDDGGDSDAPESPTDGDDLISHAVEVSNTDDDSKMFTAIYQPAKTVVLMSSAQGFGFVCCHMRVHSTEDADDDPENALLSVGSRRMTLTEVEEDDPSVGEPLLETSLTVDSDLHVFVSAVLEGSSADLAGLRCGDMLLEVDGESVAGLSLDQIHTILSLKKGDVVLKISSAITEETDAQLEDALDKYDGDEQTSGFFGVAPTKEASALYDVVRAGSVTVKFVREGVKKLKKRQWKEFMAALRGHVLYLYSPKDSMDGPLGQKPSGGRLNVKSSLVDIAYDYKKRKDVFRLQTYNGAELLIQAQNQTDMMEWIKAILAHNNPDNDASLSHDLIRRKVEQRSKNSAHTLASPFGSMKVPKKSLRSSSSNLLNVRKLRRRKSSVEGSLGSSTNPDAIFNLPIEQLCARDNVAVPLLVQKLVEEVERRGLDEEGLYRLPGSTNQVNLLQQALASDPQAADVSDVSTFHDPHALCSALKAYFRSISPPLFTSELYDALVAIPRLKAGEERLERLKDLLLSIPPAHFATAKYLIEHLTRIVAHSSSNKMHASNVALVFGPTLIRKEIENDLLLLQDMSHQSKLVEILVVNADYFFSEVPDGVVALQEDPASVLANATATPADTSNATPSSSAPLSPIDTTTSPSPYGISSSMHEKLMMLNGEPARQPSRQGSSSSHSSKKNMDTISEGDGDGDGDGDGEGDEGTGDTVPMRLSTSDPHNKSLDDCDDVWNLAPGSSLGELSRPRSRHRKSRDSSGKLIRKDVSSSTSLDPKPSPSQSDATKDGQTVTGSGEGDVQLTSGLLLATISLDDGDDDDARVSPIVLDDFNSEGGHSVSEASTAKPSADTESLEETRKRAQTMMSEFLNLASQARDVEEFEKHLSESRVGEDDGAPAAPEETVANDVSDAVSAAFEEDAKLYGEQLASVMNSAGDRHQGERAVPRRSRSGSSGRTQTTGTVHRQSSTGKRPEPSSLRRIVRADSTNSSSSPGRNFIVLSANTAANGADSTFQRRGPSSKSARSLSSSSDKPARRARPRSGSMGDLVVAISQESDPTLLEADGGHVMRAMSQPTSANKVTLLRGSPIPPDERTPGEDSESPSEQSAPAPIKHRSSSGANLPLFAQQMQRAKALGSHSGSRNAPRQLRIVTRNVSSGTRSRGSSTSMSPGRPGHLSAKASSPGRLPKYGRSASNSPSSKPTSATVFQLGRTAPSNSSSHIRSVSTSPTSATPSSPATTSSSGNVDGNKDGGVSRPPPLYSRVSTAARLVVRSDGRTFPTTNNESVI